MTERIDHVAEARHLLANYPGVVGNRPFDVAHVHATLALVEQQRIANLVALMTSAARGVSDNTVSVQDYMKMFEKLNPQVMEGLGL